VSVIVRRGSPPRPSDRGGRAHPDGCGWAAGSRCRHRAQSARGRRGRRGHRGRRGPGAARWGGGRARRAPRVRRCPGAAHRRARGRGACVTCRRAGRWRSYVRRPRADAGRRPGGGLIGSAGFVSARWPPPWSRSERLMTSRPVPEPGGLVSPVQSGAWARRVSAGAHPSSAASWTPNDERSSAGGPATSGLWRGGARRRSGLGRPRTSPCASPQYDPCDGRQRAARGGGGCDAAAQGRSALSTPVIAPWPAAAPAALHRSRARRARGPRRRQRRRRRGERWGSPAISKEAPPTRRRSRRTQPQPQPPAVSPRPKAAGPERWRQARQGAPEPLRAPGVRCRRRRWTIPRSRSLIIGGAWGPWPASGTPDPPGGG
jgi:hypothetical protein